MDTTVEVVDHSQRCKLYNLSKRPRPKSDRTSLQATNNLIYIVAHIAIKTAIMCYSCPSLSHHFSPNNIILLFRTFLRDTSSNPLTTNIILATCIKETVEKWVLFKLY